MDFGKVKMVRKSEEKPSFFKVLINRDFSKRLRLPPSFVRRNGVSEKVKIRAPYSERQWKVKVERMENNGLLCFSDGWPKFAKDAALQFGEFLVFFLVGKSEFEVVIYETSCCQRPIPPPPTNTPSLLNFNHAHATTSSYLKREDVVGISSREFGWGKSKGPLYFERILKSYQKNSLYLPAEFSRAANMGGREYVRVEYVPHHNSQSVAVENGHLPSRFDLSQGWTRFRKANNIMVGKKYSFEFNSDEDVILVNPIN